MILATALFLYGVSAVARAHSVKIGTLAVGLLIFLVSLALLVTV